MALAKSGSPRRDFEHDRSSSCQQLIKDMEEKFGVSAAAASCGRGSAGWRSARPRLWKSRPSSTVTLTAIGRQQSERHQGGACGHRAWPQRGQGPGGRCARSPSRKAFPRRMPKTLVKQLTEAGGKAEIK